ncbi:hypothetical protein [Micromonospora sp. NPDC047730]|uniref:hypothetical protein n=1 Tax=Micromonospora sp. NPDC047730 TaxID=3364253 RepID=UPI0037242B8E
MRQEDEDEAGRMLSERRPYYVQPYYLGKRHAEPILVTFALGDDREVAEVLAGVAARNQRDLSKDVGQYEIEVYEPRFRRGKVRFGQWVTRCAARAQARRGRVGHH